MLLPRTQKQQLRLHQQASNLDIEEDDDDIAICIYDAYIGFRRPRIVHDSFEDYELSDYVKARLAMAREKAMEKYRELHS